MADSIIKAGTGDNLKIQDEGGTNIISVPASGDTIIKARPNQKLIFQPATGGDISFNDDQGVEQIKIAATTGATTTGPGVVLDFGGSGIQEHAMVGSSTNMTKSGAPSAADLTFGETNVTDGQNWQFTGGSTTATFNEGFADGGLWNTVITGQTALNTNGGALMDTRIHVGSEFVPSQATPPTITPGTWTLSTSSTSISPSSGNLPAGITVGATITLPPTVVTGSSYFTGMAGPPNGGSVSVNAGSTTINAGGFTFTNNPPYGPVAVGATISGSQGWIAGGTTAIVVNATSIIMSQPAVGSGYGPLTFTNPGSTTDWLSGAGGTATITALTSSSAMTLSSTPLASGTSSASTISGGSYGPTNLTVVNIPSSRISLNLSSALPCSGGTAIPSSTFNYTTAFPPAILPGAVLSTSGAGWLTNGTAVATIVDATTITLTLPALGSGQVTPVTFTHVLGGPLTVTFTAKAANSKYLLQTRTAVILGDGDQIGLQWIVNGSSDLGHSDPIAIGNGMSGGHPQYYNNKWIQQGGPGGQAQTMLASPVGTDWILPVFASFLYTSTIAKGATVTVTARVNGTTTAEILSQSSTLTVKEIQT